MINSKDYILQRVKNMTPSMAYTDGVCLQEWQKTAREKLTDLLGLPLEDCDNDFKILQEEELEKYKRIEFVFQSEPGYYVPCTLLVPKGADKPIPGAICLQGHSTGMHISMGRFVYEGDEELVSGGDRDFAKQIVGEGYAALVIEQRAFGERKSERQLASTPDAACTCTHPAMAAMLMGRTLIGERIWDISRAIDILEKFPMVDTERIAIMGNSGGGTATYYAACMDERIKVVMPSCSVCTYKHSITAMRHCACNYIPGIAKYLDMGDLACLIAPRKLIVVAGEKDHGFLIDGVREAYATIEKIYARAGAAGNCQLVVGSEGHRFYAQSSWPVFKELSGWS